MRHPSPCHAARSRSIQRKERRQAPQGAGGHLTAKALCSVSPPRRGSCAPQSARRTHPGSPPSCATRPQSRLPAGFYWSAPNIPELAPDPPTRRGSPLRYPAPDPVAHSHIRVAGTDSRAHPAVGLAQVHVDIVIHWAEHALVPKGNHVGHLRQVGFGPCRRRCRRHHQLVGVTVSARCSRL